MKVTIFIICVASLLLAGAASAVTCSPAVSLQTTPGNVPASQVIICSNSLNSSVSSIYQSGNFYSISPNPIVINGSSTSAAQLSFNSNLLTGYNEGAIFFADSFIFPVVVNVSQPVQSGCNLNPSLIAYTQAIQQGTQVPLPKITFSPTNCPTTLTLSSSNVYIQGGTLTSSGQKPVSITSIVNDGVNLAIDTAGLNTQQTYSSTLNINAFSKSFQIPFVITVTAGATPYSNFSIGNLPLCSLTNTVLNLNSTYNMVCTNIQPDVTIAPDADYEYIQGVGLDTSSNQFIWYFQPIKYGNTIIKAKFSYRNVPVGQPYKQEVKISSSGAVSPGTNLALLFTPSLTAAKPNQEVLIQVIDNKSASLISSPELYINANQLAYSNGVFRYNFSSFMDYSVRARAGGYDDLVSTVRLQNLPLFINIKPETGDASTNFGVDTSAGNASLFLDDTKITNPYNGTLTTGNHTFRAIKEGYFDAFLNISIEPSLSAQETNPIKKGTEAYITISKNISWTLYYQKSADSLKETIGSGVGNSVKFTPDKSGTYTLYTQDGKFINSWTLSGWNGKILSISWYWYALLLFAVGLFIYIRNHNSSSQGLAYAPTINT